jgi:hypothetical protein
MMLDNMQPEIPQLNVCVQLVQTMRGWRWGKLQALPPVAALDNRHFNDYIEAMGDQIPMSGDEEKDTADYLIELMKHQNVVCSTMKNGHLLMFKKKWLVDLLADHPDSPQIYIFINRLDFVKGN